MFTCFVVPMQPQGTEPQSRVHCLLRYSTLIDCYRTCVPSSTVNSRNLLHASGTDGKCFYRNSHISLCAPKIKLHNCFNIYLQQYNVQLFINKLKRFILSSKQVEYFYPQDRLRPAPIAATSCRRCELDQQSGERNQWGLSDNSVDLGSLASAVRTRSGFRSTPPRVTALSWRDRF